MSKHKATNETTSTTAALGYSMPAEWERHEATWLIWPHNQIDWPDKVATVRWVYGEIVRKICPGEIVRILVNSKIDEKLARDYLARAGADLAASNSSSIPLIAAGRVTRDPSSSSEAQGGRPPSSTSTSTRGPGTTTGRRTAACQRPQPGCSASGCLMRGTTTRSS
jgi:hypothetical protein